MLLLLNKYFATCGACLAVVGAVVLIQGGQQKNASHESLVVGLQSGYPPFEYNDVEGNIVGFDVDLAKCIASKLGKDLVLKDMEFEGEILSLKQGKIDLIISGMNITPSRLKEISMVPYHGEEATQLSLIFWDKIPEGVQSLEDLAQKTGAVISVESGSISEDFMSSYPNIPIRSFEGSLAPLMDVKYGKSIANIVEQDTAEYLTKQHSQVRIVQIPIPKEVAISGFGIGVKKENLELYKRVNEIVVQLKETGEMKNLEDRWFGGANE
jgi:ABC-type amino acid transport substrate-binding protein